MTHVSTVAAIALAFSLAGTSAVAQGTGEADAKEIQAYKLTMAGTKQFVAATRNLLAAVKQDARYIALQKLEAEMKVLEDKEEPSEADTERIEKLTAEIETLENSTPNVASGSQSLNEMERAIEKEPLMANALKSAGMSPRDYAKFSLAFFQATMIQGMQKAGLVKQIPKELQAQVNLENIKFLEDNQAELAAVMAELQAMGKQK